MYQPVIIIGAPRSGTNMLRDILTSLEGFSSWPCDEINYIWRYGNASYPTDEFTPEMASEKTQGYIQKQFDQRAAADDSKYLVEKTCANSLRVAFVDRIIPNAKFIFICRDGIDATASAKKRWKAALNLSYIFAKARFVPVMDLPYYGAKYLLNRIKKLFSRKKELAYWGPALNNMQSLLSKHTLDEVCALQWQRCVENSLSDLEYINADRVHKIRYEDFVTDPTTELKSVLRFLGAETTAVEKTLLGNISSSSIGKGRADFGTDKARALDALIADTQRKLGYV